MKGDATKIEMCQNEVAGFVRGEYVYNIQQMNIDLAKYLAAQSFTNESEKRACTE